MPPFAESQEQDPIIMSGYYDDDTSVITDDSFFDKPKQNGNTDTHDVRTKNETSKVVLSFYDVMMDFNLCCSSTLHDDDETIVAGSTRKTSCKYAQAEISLPHKKYNNNKIQEEEEEVEIEQEKVMMSTNDNNTTLASEKNKKKCSRVYRLHKSTSSIQKVHSRQSTTTTTTTTAQLSSSSNQKEKKSNIMTVWIKKSLSIQKLKSIRTTMNKPAINKKKKKTSSVMMTNGTFLFKKTKNRNRNRNKKETSPDSYNTAGLSSFVKQMHRMGYSRSVTTKQNHAYNEIRAK